MGPHLWFFMRIYYEDNFKDLIPERFMREVGEKNVKHE